MWPIHILLNKILLKAQQNHDLKEEDDMSFDEPYNFKSSLQNGNLSHSHFIEVSPCIRS